MQRPKFLFKARMGSQIFDLNDLSRFPRALNEAHIRNLCSAVYLGGNDVLCRALGRYKMYVDSQDSGLSPHLMIDGYWEMWLTEVLASLLRPGMVVADIGANLGYFTLLMAEMVGAAGQVFAFEPNMEMSRRLRKSVSVNGFDERVKVESIALGHENGQHMQLIVPENEPKNAHVIPTPDNGEVHGSALISQRLDSNPDWHRIELMKIDVEGAEERLWNGMEGLLAGSTLKTVIVEFAACRYTQPELFLQAMTARGFDLQYVDLKRGIQRITSDGVLARNPREDIMLVLRR